MTDSPARTESIGESADDSQLRIKIPNPKLYLARQSQWKGRRGKPRCDHCRLNNLKCDRVLPTCNHCSWANRECKYTPLPTPAHRGIPRCDRCRFHNLKCDRNLPICNHCTEDEEAECNYTPKKRHKVPTDHGTTRDRPTMPYAAKTASFLVSETPSDEKFSTGNWIMEHPEEGVSPADLPDGLYEISSETDDSDDDDDDDGDISPAVQAFLAQHEKSWEVKLTDPRSLVSSGPSGSRHRFESSLQPNRHIEPWYHPAFAPLPRPVLQGIRTVSPAEVPTRQDFDESLFRFLAELPPELREISAFAPDPYSELARSVANGDVAELSPRIRSWLTCHHVRPGSRKFHLLLLPREAYFSIKAEKEERLRNDYIAEVDGEAGSKLQNGSSSHGPVVAPHEGTTAFIRIPVSPQIYDVLVYAHKTHPTTSAALAQIRQAGIACITWPMVELFHRLCPVCRSKAHRASGAV